ncbi:ABC transporter substrate-binding protein [Corynebacterium kutscheri]|uniref:ABC transporter substrate-binding protein n=1 Tax=Corynebacterium kutscheri TaxID=35755 RepID=A0A0F6TCT1_9CORY|nr:ABC transporter family substrate-binding protein [Corynebacterium kutscheri]AKE40539.1 ABC-type dipeptide transport system, periplasmic component [Corynebacterium kutscheri]VEH05000.1 ABC transporter substrate-binding protein [Corynebacterium kutscheri]VEH10934.1 ABC transporter substrate-binding protein [Corynebacterium kutscheri]VEH80590.1 ABC transporter substrate-binding protein [Corynebacterium kutscheri]
MKKYIRNVTIAAVSIAALTLAACGSDGNSSSSTANNSSSSTSAGGLEINLAGSYAITDRDQIQDGGTLTLPIAEIAHQQNVFHGDMSLYTRTLWSTYNPQVTLFDGAGNWEANPDYISEVTDEVVDGKTVVTYTVVDEATYNDGTPIDWRAFENTWKFNNGFSTNVVPNSSDGYDLVESVTRGDTDKQAVVTFSRTYAWWQGLFNNLLHPAVDSEEKFNTLYLDQVQPDLGAGPFKIEKVDFNTGEATFVRNEKWWGDEAKLEKITYRQLESQATINAFQAGEIDAASVATKDNLAIARGMGDAIELRAAMTPSNYLLTINSAAPHLGDIKVREAIMTAIDRSQLAAIRFNGLDYSEPLPGSFLLYPSQEGYVDNFGSIVSFDVDKAKSLLSEAGYAEGSDGFVQKDGQTLSLRYVITGDSQMVKSTATAMQKMLKDIGIDMQVVERPSADFSRVVAEKDFDLFMSGFRASDPFGVAGINQIYASDSSLNNSGTGTPEIDAKLLKLQDISDPDEQTKAAMEVEKEALATYGIMPYANGPDITAVKKGLVNYGAFFFAIMPKEDIGWIKN